METPALPNFTSSTQVFSSSSPSSPRIFRNIARRLASSSQALEFFDYIRSNSPSQDLKSLSFTFQAIFELAGREPDPQNTLLELYRTSKERNIPLTVKGATLLVRCFGRAERVDEALAVVDELDPSLKSTHFYNVVVDLLFRSGRIVEALNMLDEMLQPGAHCPPNDITGGVIFAALSRMEWFGRSISDEEIFGLVSKLLDHGVFPDTFKLTQLITKLCRNKKIGRAWDVLHDVMKADGTVKAVSCNALLTWLGRDGDFERMKKLMTEMIEMDIQPNVVTFGILLNHMCKSWRVDEALEVFEKMKGGSYGLFVEPNVITYNTLIDGLCKVGKQEEGLTLMDQMRSENKCMPNTVTYNCLSDGFCKAGEIERAQDLFDQMNKERVFPDVITLATLVGGMCRHGRINSAVQFFNEMRSAGLKGDALTFNILIKALCNVNNIDKAMELFEKMKGVTDGLSVEPDLITYNTLIDGLCKVGKQEEGLTLMDQMRSENKCMPDTVTYNCLIDGFCKAGTIERAQGIFDQMNKERVFPDVITLTTLVGGMCRHGRINSAAQFFDEMRSEGLKGKHVTFTTLIKAFCSVYNIDKAMELFNQMSKDGCSPDAIVPQMQLFIIH
ncbi:hypothetical protein CIPAW_01G066600 [Carya illinoinensis]|uniref:Pentatricopeptide repeat-containing protein n=1 Tax=Carya illinoinensis TaxID=32201 RepID=A0A8T1RKR9_CARIL|nr:hypothetical protein CIPAW_01G066600 [Carya illinoinensis]